MRPIANMSLPHGRNFKQDEFFTAVVGVASRARHGHWRWAMRFSLRTAAPEGHKHDPFEVVGILKRTGTPADRAVFVNMEGFYLMGGHSRKVASPPAQGAGSSAAGYAEIAHRKRSARGQAHARL